MMIQKNYDKIPNHLKSINAIEVDKKIANELGFVDKADNCEKIKKKKIHLLFFYY